MKTAGAEEKNVYLALGSNTGDRESNLLAGIDLLKKVPGFHLMMVSQIYENLPAEGVGGGYFYNIAITATFSGTVRELLRHTQDIEKQLGRTSKGDKAPRPLDIDILLLDDEVVNEPDLVVPHPRMGERIFVLKPLSEIAPDALHPLTHKTILELYSDLLKKSLT